MKIVVDANVLLSAMIKDSITRKVLLEGKHKFYFPEYGYEEIEKKLDVISKKEGLEKAEAKQVLETLKKHVVIVEAEFYKLKIAEAEKIMAEIDRKDVPYLAAALFLAGSAIWSFDKDFKKQKAVKVVEIQALL